MQVTYNPNDPLYWDKTALKGEIDRIYDICHGCRLCFNLCPTFPELFRFIDHHDGCVDRTQGACDCGADVIAAQDNGEVAHCCSAAGIPTSMAAS